MAAAAFAAHCARPSNEPASASPAPAMTSANAWVAFSCRTLPPWSSATAKSLILPAKFLSTRPPEARISAARAVSWGKPPSEGVLAFPWSGSLMALQASTLPRPRADLRAPAAAVAAAAATPRAKPEAAAGAVVPRSATTGATFWVLARWGAEPSRGKPCGATAKPVEHTARAPAAHAAPPRRARPPTRLEPTAILLKTGMAVELSEAAGTALRC
mmetsp:Transcript_94799/g.238976  ORF Transcript_94799/g.238976 Transcript_94799/m.238976 type:complete len:215 (+) Transcript_94799:467-1111(+)